MDTHYEFRIAGRLSADLVTSFAPMTSTRTASDTTFVCSVHDDGEFFGIVSRLELLGLRLISLRELQSDDVDRG